MARARFALLPHGDTPTSQRIADAFEANTLPVAIAHDFFPQLDPRIIPWRSLILDATRPVPSDVAAELAHIGMLRSNWRKVDEEGGALADRLAAIATMPDEEVQRRRIEMDKFAPMLSWQCDPSTTANLVLAQAARSLETKGWID